MNLRKTLMALNSNTKLGRAELATYLMVLSSDAALRHKVRHIPLSTDIDTFMLNEELRDHGYNIEFRADDFAFIQHCSTSKKECSDLPYGVGLDKTKSFVIFDRDYRPIYRFGVHQKPVRVSNNDYVQFANLGWFYEDAISPLFHRCTYIEITIIRDALEFHTASRVDKNNDPSKR